VSARVAPITGPCLGVVALLGWWTADRSGFPIGLWAPGLLIALALLGVAVVVVPNAWGTLPRPVLGAVALLFAYTAWSFLSISWAEDPGVAVEGATRTLLYLVVFALFALWPQRPTGALVVLGAWVAVVTGVAAWTALRLATEADPTSLFNADRMIDPAGYPNAAAASWLIALFPAVALVSAARVPAWLRAVAAVGAVLMDLSLLSLSRGALYALPVTAAAFFLLVPGRVRALLALIVLGAAIAPTVPVVLDVADAFDPGGEPKDAIASAGRTMLLAALAAGVVVAGIALLEGRRRPSPERERAFVLAGRGFAALVLAAVLVGGLVVAGDPVERIDDGWQSFKGGYGELDADAPRLVGGLGSNRYDFYRVGLDVFSDHPLAGIGADNFQQEYLRRGDSTETPRYPHSLELRTLAQTGIVGVVLLFGAFGFALVAAMRGMRSGGSLAAAVAGGATIAFGSWGIHGSIDWFFEYAGLGVAAFAMLGLACSLCPRRAAGAGDGAVPRPAFTARARGAAEIGAVVAVGCVCAIPAVALWFADREQDRAARVFATHPGEAYQRLHRAARLLPMSDAPKLLEGSIALRLDDLDRADRAFAEALDRVPDGQYATLQRGAIASVRGDRATALRLVRRAAELAPRDPTTREVLAVVRDGGAVDLDELARRILAENDLSG
jgi:hypothetical protein